jgi:hypothetical protein
LLLLLLLNGS